MADKKISDFTAATTVASGDLFEMENAGGNSRKITAANLAAGLKAVGFRGCLAYNSADRTGLNQTAGGVLTFNSESYDTDSIHDTSSNTSRLTVPTGVTYVRLSYAISAQNVTGGADCFAAVKKNGSFMTIGAPSVVLDAQSSTIPRVAATSPILAVTAGDYFELDWQTTGDTASDVLSAGTWFAMEIIA